MRFLFLTLLMMFPMSICNLISPAPQSGSEPRHEESVQVTVSAEMGWQSTGLFLRTGDRVTIDYVTGAWRGNPDDPFCGPDGGSSYICAGSNCVEHLPGYPQLGLVGRLGDALIFPVGSHFELVMASNGMLELGPNDMGLYDNEGSVVMRIRVNPRTEVTINADRLWQSTGMRVEAGDQITIEYLSGMWRADPNDPFHGPDGGSSYICTRNDCVEPLPDYPKGMLIGRIGNTPIFPVGNTLSMTVQSGGILELRVNDTNLSDNEGSITLGIIIE